MIVSGTARKAPTQCHMQPQKQTLRTMTSVDTPKRRPSEKLENITDGELIARKPALIPDGSTTCTGGRGQQRRQMPAKKSADRRDESIQKRRCPRGWIIEH